VELRIENLSKTYRNGVKALDNGLPSPFSAEGVLSLFECLIGTMPLSDSSETCIRAARP
jgi:hypothetical protein